MATISITISESTLYKVAGIPVSIVLTANIPSTIFFTLDGTDPDTSSPVAIGPIQMPMDEGTVILKAFATDGLNTSPIITNIYGTTTVGNRAPHATVFGLNQTSIGATYPFGSQDPGDDRTYGNTGGTTVDSPLIPGIPDGYDGEGNGTHSNETDLPLTSYEFVFSEANRLGETGKGIGTLPADVTVVIPPPLVPGSVASGSPDVNSPFFNAKALVIFDDARDVPYDPTLPRTNRPNFSLEDVTRARYGAQLFTPALDGPPPRGTQLKPQYNPRDNTIKYYYFDSDTNRWIISIVPYSPRDPNMGDFSRIVFGRDRGVGAVYQWRLFGYRTLF
jgi:hypothetical protein